MIEESSTPERIGRIEAETRIETMGRALLQTMRDTIQEKYRTKHGANESVPPEEMFASARASLEASLKTFTEEPFSVIARSVLRGISRTSKLSELSGDFIFALKIELLKDSLNPETAQSFLRNLQARSNSWTEVNEFLLYGTKEGNVDIHIPARLVQESPTSAWDGFIRGLQELARGMREGRVSIPTQVTGDSSLVANPAIARFLQREGFEIGDIRVTGPGGAKGIMRMDGEKFIDRYAPREI